jgi:hypothetical protein
MAVSVSTLVTVRLSEGIVRERRLARRTPTSVVIFERRLTLRWIST